MWKTNKVPIPQRFIPDKLPVENKPNDPVLVCAAGDTVCNTDTALGYETAGSYMPVKASDLDDFTVNALIDAEDKTFMSHNGNSGKGQAAATVINALGGLWDNANLLVHGKKPTLGAFIIRGGSTITSQMASITYMHEDPYAPAWQKVLDHKDEMLLAASIEQKQHMSKLDIIVKYANHAETGKGAIGFNAGSMILFGKERPKDLEDYQKVLLVSMVNAPSYLSSPAGLKALADRYQHIINTMHELGDISDKKYASLQHDKQKFWVETDDGKPKTKSPFIEGGSFQTSFTDKVDALGLHGGYNLALYQASDELGVEHAYDLPRLYPGLKIYTSFDTKLQGNFYKSVRANKKLMNSKTTNIGGVIMKQNGEVAAMIGSKDYRKYKPNLAIGDMYGQGSGRDFGSTNKTWALAYAYDHGWTPKGDKKGKALTLPKTMDLKLPDGTHWPITSGDECASLGLRAPCYERGVTTPANAYAASSNMLVGDIYNDFGSKGIASKMHDLGLPADPNKPSFMIGQGGAYSPWNEAAAEGSLTNGGESVDPHVVLKMTNIRGQQKPYKYADKAPNPKKVYSAKAARWTLQAQQGVITGYGTARGTIYPPNGMKSMGVKTGTGQNSANVALIGAACDQEDGDTEYFSFALWAGNPQGDTRLTDIKHGANLAPIMNDVAHREWYHGEGCDIRDAATAGTR